MVTVFFFFRTIDALLNSPVKGSCATNIFRRTSHRVHSFSLRRNTSANPSTRFPCSLPASGFATLILELFFFFISTQQGAMYLSFHMFIKTYWLDTSTLSTNLVWATRGTFWLLRSKQTWNYLVNLQLKNLPFTKWTWVTFDSYLSSA